MNPYKVQYFFMIHFAQVFPVLLLQDWNPVPMYSLAWSKRQCIAKTLHLATALHKEVPCLCFKALI